MKFEITSLSLFIPKNIQKKKVTDTMDINVYLPIVDDK